MHKLIDYICDELYALEEKIDRQGKLSGGEIEYGDVLAHFGKNLVKLEEHGNSYRGNSYMGNSYDDGNSYRGRRNARRDRMGRYSGERGYSRSDLADKMRSLMHDAPDDRTRQEIQRMVEKLENA